MKGLPDTARLRDLLLPFALVEGSPVDVPEEVFSTLETYLHLLVRWNARTNLTAVRDPEEMIQRHFGEGLFAALWLAKQRPGAGSLLDFGSGAGIPGLPMQVALPAWSVTLAESQGKKVAFLREAVRVLYLSSDVWAGRVEAMPSARRFDVVTMRAVDRMETMRPVALGKVASGGLLLEFVSGGEKQGGMIPIPARRDSWIRVTAC